LVPNISKITHFMLSFSKLDKYTFKVELYNDKRQIKCDIEELYKDNRLKTLYQSLSKGTIPKIPFNVLYECYDPQCIYSRHVSHIRTIMEEKMVHLSKKLTENKKINVLFFSSYLLLQEIKIILSMGKMINEVHITDYTYKKLFNTDSGNIYYLGILQFLLVLNYYQIKPELYVHTDPKKIKKLDWMKNRLDLIFGVDIDDINHPCYYTRNLILSLSIFGLREKGKILISQNFLDLVDITIYSKNHEYMKIIDVEHYVKLSFWKHFLRNNIIFILMGILFLLSFLNQSYGLFLISLMMSLVGIIFQRKYFFYKKIRHIKSILK
jgi:hypothetical protein